MTMPSKRGIARLDSLAGWTKHRPSLCDGCYAACCRLPVEASAADLVRLGLINEDEAAGSLKKVARRLEKDGVVRHFRAATGIFTLAQTPGGDCLYLDARRRCTVYDRRPETCRRFPQVGPRPGYCPALKLPTGAG